MSETDIVALADGNMILRGPRSLKGHEAAASRSGISRIERMAFYAGAIGLGLGHSLSAQLVLLAYQLYRLAVDPNARAVRATRSTIVLLALGAWMMVSGVSAVSRFDAWGGTVGMVLSVWVTLGAVNRVMTDRTGLGRRLMRSFLVSSTFGAVYGLTVFGLYLSGRGGLPRAELPFGGCNLAGTVFAVAIVVALGCIGFARRWEKIALIIMVAVMGAALGATQSRGGLVALGVGLTVLLVVSLRSRRSGKTLVLALLGLFAVFVTCAAVYPPLLARYASIVRPSANSDRFEIWRTAIHMLRDHPILGVGVNNFHEVYLSYPHPEERSHEVMSTAHNILMEFGASTGIPGLALFLGVICLGIANGARACGLFRARRVLRIRWACSLPPAPEGATEQASGTAAEQADGEAMGHVRGASGVALAAFATLLAHLQFDLTIYSGNMLPLFFIVYGVLTYFGEHVPARVRECEGARSRS
ncbi:MAG TPA: hypothetical protein GX515_04795 [Firmicutes bacterium]|nr:hypothetical protein [Bacillota bacterium]